MVKLRTLTVFMAFVALAFIVISAFVPVELVVWDKWVMLIAEFLVAFGIITASGDTRELTRDFFLSKLKSPIAYPTLIALIGYGTFRWFGEDVSALIVQQVTSLIALIFGLGITNNPNNQQALK